MKIVHKLSLTLAFVFLLAAFSPPAQADEAAVNEDIIGAIKHELEKNNIRCTPKIQIARNIFRLVFAGSLKIGMECESGGSTLSGSVLLKIEAANGCSEAVKHRVLSKIDAEPISAECSRDDRGRETFAAFYLKKLSLEAVYF